MFLPNGMRFAYLDRVAELCADAPLPFVCVLAVSCDSPLPFSAARLDAAVTASVSFGLAFMTVSSMTWRPGVGASVPVLRNPSFFLLRSRSSTAALSERRRIFAAPRLETSSIFSMVYTSALSARISDTWSVVMASRPQPKELSCTSSSPG